MNLKNIKIVLFLLAFPLVFTGCELFGLDFQDSYDYDYKAGIPSNKVNMSTYDFIKSRPDIFSILQEAIDFAKLENEFKQPNATYILPTNTAFTSETATDLSYFQTHKLEAYDEELGLTYLYAPSSMTVYPVQQVKDFLLYHIVVGKYTHTNMPAEPTWYSTFAAADTAKVNLYILKDRNPNIVFNNFDGHYKSTIKPRTANLYSDDGSYIHVIDSWLDRPTAKQMNLK
ncbi:fasciclin domain-containing protein [Bacteroides sp. UBA939]|uniref:fasciclin domain-containing protein n=1 Tax=Bacteroides sp. UBA939 TaxID=1946092 RepID=UPI0025BFFA45|nr:fasciclin domain-containing protein [Bacteroides sp. UBA939]